MLPGAPLHDAASHGATAPGRPVYKHDCEACIFLGSFEIGGHVEDGYWCGEDANDYSLIHRWGNDGPEYGAMPAGHASIASTGVYGILAHLTIARRLTTATQLDALRNRSIRPQLFEART